MSEKEIKRILLTTGYTTQTDKDAIYHYIKELKEIIEEVRGIIESGLDFDDPQYADECKKELLQILDKVKEQ